MAVERTGLEAYMDIAGYRVNAKEYLDSLAAMIAANKTLDNTVKAQASALGAQEKEVKRAAAALTTLEKATAKTKRESEAAAKAIKAQVESTGRFYASAGRNLQQLGRTMSRYITLPLVAAGGASVKFAVDFEQKMANIQSIGKQTTSELASLGDEFLAMSTDLEKSSASAIELADAFYFLQGSGFEGADAMKILKVASQASQAGITDLRSATDGLVYSLNAYGAEAGEARKYSDILFRTIDLGILEYGEFSNAIGLVTGQAAASGVSFVELNAAIASISRTTKGAGRIAREFNTFLTGMTDPTKQLNELFLSVTGHTAAWMLENEGLSASLRVIADATGGSAEKINALFGDMRAGRAITSLMRDDMSDFEKLLKGIADSAGATAEAAAINIDTTAAAFTNLKNSAIAAGIKLAEAYLPTIQKIVEAMVEFTEWVSNLSKGQKDLILYLGGILAVMGPLAGIFGTGLELYGNLTIATVKLGVETVATKGAVLKLIAGFLGPVGLVIAIGLAVVATVALVNKSKELTEQFHTTSSEILLTAKTYEEYAEGVDKAASALPAMQTQLVLSHGKNTELREGMKKTREEFEKFHKMLNSLGSVTQEFSDSLDEGNLSLKILRELAYDAKIAIGDMSIESAKYANQWRDNENIIDIPEEWAKAWLAAAKEIQNVFLGMADVLRENEDALNELVAEGIEERDNLITENSTKIIAMRQEQQAEVIALEQAYLARQADLQAAGDAEGLQKLDEAFQKKRLKMEQAFAQDDLDLAASNERQLLEQERGQLEQLISLHDANADKIEAQREKLGMTVFLTALEEAMKDGEVDAGEKKILETLGIAFGLQIDAQIQFGIDSLVLAAALKDDNIELVEETATEISKRWSEFYNTEKEKANKYRQELGLLALPESIYTGTDYSSFFTGIGGGGDGGGGAPTPATPGGGGGGGGGTKDNAVKSLQDTVKDVADAIDEAIEAFEKLAKYRTSPRLKQALTDIARDITDAITILVRTWETRDNPIKKEAEKAAEFAEYASTIVSAFGNASDSLVKVADYSGVSEKALRQVATDIGTAVRVMHETWASGEGLANRAAQFSEHAVKVVDAFSKSAEAFNSIKYYTGVSRAQMVRVASDMDQMMRILEWHMKQLGPEIIPQADEFASASATIAGSVSTGAKALSGLRTYSGMARQHAVALAEDLATLMKEYSWALGQLGPEVVPQAIQFAKSADAITTTVKGAVGALGEMRWYTGVSDRRMRRLVSDIAKIIWLLNTELNKLGLELLEDTAHFSESGQVALDFIAKGIEPLISLQEYSGVAEDVSKRFAEDLAMTVENLGLAMKNLTPDVLPYAVEFADGATSITDMVASAVEALVTLQNDYKGVDEEKIIRLRDDFILLATALSNLGNAEEVTPGLIQFLDVISELVAELNALPDKIHIDFSVGGSGIPSFQDGGTVPGPPSRASLAIVHGGERVIPAAASNVTSGIASTVNNNRTNNWQFDAHYANTQSEGSLRNDIEMIQLLTMGN